MTDRDRYKETFSQVHSRRTLNWEEFERMERKRKKYRPLRLLAAAAAVALLIGAPTMGAIAANFLGLRDLLLPVALTGDWARPLSLSGYLDTPESQALAEWVQFQADYDPDHTILDSVGNTLDPSLANYNAYLVYTPEMADRLEEIAAKYDLKLHSASYDGADHPELVEPLGNFLGQANGQVTYMYEDGTFHVDGWAQLTTDGYEPVEFQLQRSVKGTLHDALVYLDPGQFTEWDYTTQKGLPVKLALGPERSMILVDFRDCFVTVLVLGGVEQYMDAAIQHGLTPAHLEELADQLDLGLLSPVVTPRPDPEPVRTPNPPAGERTDARRTYAALLRDLCNSGVLPDGQTAEMDPTYDTFAVLDVDGDDREELILLHTSGITAGMTGYVIDFDEGYTGGGAPIYIQMSDYPIFTFYSSGYMTAGASHNQGWAGEVLWPYSLYRHTEGDRYACIATLDAWDPDIWPDAYGEGSEARQVHRRSGGPGYFVSYTYASELPDDQRFLVLDKAGYEAWLENLDLGRQLDIRTLPLTEENIAAMEQASPITAGSLASADLPTDVSQGVTVLGSYLFPLTVDGEPSLRVEASSEGYWPNEFAQTLTLEIYLGEVEESSQTLTGTTGMAGEEFQLYCSDVDFDGDLDLYVTYSQGVENTFYAFYLWDAGAEQFVPDTYGLGELSNVKFNVDEQFVVASRKTSFSEEITYYRYKEGQLAMVRQLAYDLSADPKVMRVTEVTVGEEWEPLRIVTPGDFTDEDWDEFLAWMDLTYFGEE